jgi:shikimate kinase
LDAASEPGARATRREVVLIGPVGAGKSTQGELLSKALGLPHVDLDHIAVPYYEAAGFPIPELDRRLAENFLSAYRWAWSALVFALERVVDDRRDCVISLGAGHTHYEDPDLLARARAALAPFANVVLLLPSPDLQRSFDVLKTRSIEQRKMDWVFDGYDFFQHWVFDPCNAELATTTIYTDGKTPEETRDDILAVIR